MSTSTISVLSVEDNDFDVRRVERGFAKLGYDMPFARACDGVEALDILRRDVGDGGLARPVVVLLDLNMPRMGGLEFLDQLRADPSLRTIPVFVITTSDFHKDITAAHQRLISGYLVKPHSAHQMVAVLQTLVNFWRTCEYPA